MPDDNAATEASVLVIASVAPMLPVSMTGVTDRVLPLVDHGGGGGGTSEPSAAMSGYALVPLWLERHAEEGGGGPKTDDTANAAGDVLVLTPRSKVEVKAPLLPSDEVVAPSSPDTPHSTSSTEI